MKFFKVFMGIFVVLFTLNSCEKTKPVTEKAVVKEIRIAKPLLPCLLDSSSFSCKTSRRSPTGNYISKSTAFIFFNIYKKLDRFDPEYLDSLPEKFRNPNRQEIYKAYSLVGEYVAFVETVLDSLSIKINDYSDKKGNLILKDRSGVFYIIDLSQFAEKDGVLLFNPSKKPVFWPSGIKGPCDTEASIRLYYEGNEED